MGTVSRFSLGPYEVGVALLLLRFSEDAEESVLEVLLREVGSTRGLQELQRSCQSAEEEIWDSLLFGLQSVDSPDALFDIFRSLESAICRELVSTSPLHSSGVFGQLARRFVLAFKQASFEATVALYDSVQECLKSYEEDCGMGSKVHGSPRNPCLSPAPNAASDHDPDDLHASHVAFLRFVDARRDCELPTSSSGAGVAQPDCRIEHGQLLAAYRAAAGDDAPRGGLRRAAVHLKAENPIGAVASCMRCLSTSSGEAKAEALSLLAKARLETHDVLGALQLAEEVGGQLNAKLQGNLCLVQAEALLEAQGTGGELLQSVVDKLLLAANRFKEASSTSSQYAHCHYLLARCFHQLGNVHQRDYHAREFRASRVSQPS